MRRKWLVWTQVFKSMEIIELALGSSRNLVVERELALAEHEDTAQHELGDPARVRLGVPEEPYCSVQPDMQVILRRGETGHRSTLSMSTLFDVGDFT